MKILLRDIKKAEKDYAISLKTWGERNQATLNAMVKYYDLKKQYEEQKKK